MPSSIVSWLREDGLDSTRLTLVHILARQLRVFITTLTLAPREIAQARRRAQAISAQIPS